MAISKVKQISVVFKPSMLCTGSHRTHSQASSAVANVEKSCLSVPWDSVWNTGNSNTVEIHCTTVTKFLEGLAPRLSHVLGHIILQV